MLSRIISDGLQVQSVHDVLKYEIIEKRLHPDA